MRQMLYVVLSKDDPQTFSDKKKAQRYAKNASGELYDALIVMDETLNIGYRGEPD